MNRVSTSNDLQTIQKTVWDVIVIGTGMGGGTAGYELARLGKRVLFLEKGRSYLPGAVDAITGRFPEQAFDLKRLSDKEYLEQLARAGRNVDELEDDSGKKVKRFRPVLGSGTGGSSALYGMVAERFFPSDFEPRRHFRNAGNSTAPEAWPITYEEMTPWYEKAEQLYRVHGSADPLRPDTEGAGLRPVPSMCPANETIFDRLSGMGLHPYRLHLACDFLPGCKACQSFICAAGCKNDSAKICVAPAVNEHGATLLTETSVVGIEATKTRATRLRCRRGGEDFAVEGKVIVLGAGALMTPALLMASQSAEWPAGLANEHDQVGRNFMRHCIDMYIFRVRDADPSAGNCKEISLNDFYLAEDKFGTIQSLGHVPPYEFVMNSNRKARFWMGLIRPAMGRVWHWLESHLVPMASIMEDLPYSSNRIVPGPGIAGGDGPVARITYRLQEPDRRRLKAFQNVLKSAFKTAKPMFVPVSKENSALGHQCGTCRFGDDPKTSVLDQNNRAWGLDNLYVVDSSFLPTSGGINPSLTLAANALRVARVINERH